MMSCFPPALIVAMTPPSRAGAGAISTTFWCRRWTEQSARRGARCRRRRPPGPAPPMWRGRRDGLLEDSVASPNALRPRASPSRALPRSPAGSSTRRIRVPRRRRRPWRTRGSRSRPRPPRARRRPRTVPRSAARERPRPGRLDRAHLVPGHRQYRRRPDEGDAGRLARTGQAGVLGQEAVARVDGVRSGLARDPDDLGRCPGRPAPGGHACRSGTPRRPWCGAPRCGLPRGRRPRCGCRARRRHGRPGRRSPRGWRRAAWRTWRSR